MIQVVFDHGFMLSGNANIFSALFAKYFPYSVFEIIVLENEMSPSQ